MAQASVSMREETLNTLRDLAQRSGRPVETVLVAAVEAYRRQFLLEETNNAFAALRRDPVAWQDEQMERAAWDITIADGIEES